ncbi:MAG: hypothetical protein WC184_08195 [Acidimicrobiia bacterium]
MNAEENVNDALRQLHRGVTEAATIAVGLGVLGVNRVQVLRREVQRLFCSPLDHSSDT